MELFKLFGKIVIEGSEEANGALEAIGKTAVKVGKAVVAGLGVCSAAVAGVTKAAIGSYADYEQLVGGVQTLFGTGGKSIEEYAESVGKTVDAVAGEYQKLKAAEDAVSANAQKAYRTAGLSANEYMETVTSFSAALISSLDGDTVKAAEIADMAIQDMADNANKMGTDIASIQNAYQGFAKQNYTMLDNLKLGYGGTKEEMQRLLKDAQKLSGVKYNINNLNDIYAAIHVIQEEMGITGATAAEAGGTISGSLAAAKASWQNLLTGFADGNQDLGGLISVFVDSVGAAADNLVPRIVETLAGLSEALPALVEQFIPVLQEVTVALLPGLLRGATSLLQGLFAAIPAILKGLFQSLEGATDGVLGAVLDVISEIGLMIMDLFGWLQENEEVLIILGAAIGVITTALGLNSAAVALSTAMEAAEVTSLGALISAKYADAAASLAALAPYLLIAAAIAAVIAIGVLLVKNWDTVKAKCVELWNGMKESFNNIKETVVSVWDGIWSSIKGVINNIIGGVENMVNRVIDGINSLLSGVSMIVSAVGSVLGLDWSIGQIPNINLPRLEKGGVLEEGQMGLLEGNGAEAVVPLDQNHKWIAAVAKDMDAAMGGGSSEQMKELIAAFKDFVEALPVMMTDAFATMKFDVNNREFARLVKAVN